MISNERSWLDWLLIGGDGRVYNAHAISGEGLSDDPSLRKAAEEAVLQWRYEPGTFDGKPFQSGFHQINRQ